MPDFNLTLILVIVSFVIFMLLMKAIYFDPMLKIKLAREEKMNADQASAQQLSQEFEQIEANYQATIQKARKDAHTVIQTIQQDARRSSQETIQKARAEVQADLERQMTDLHQWQETTYQEMAPDRNILTQTVIHLVRHGHSKQHLSDLVSVGREGGTNL